MRYQTVRSIINNTSRQQILCLGLLVLVLLVNAVLSYMATRDLIEKEARVQKTLNFLVAIKDTFSTLQDAETGQRGFLITGEAKYLEPYENALADMDGHLAILLNLQPALPEQQKNIQHLIGLIQQKREEMARVVSLHKSQLNQAALQLERSDRGFVLMREIRLLVREMEQLEYRVMRSQRLEASYSARQVIFAIGLATFLGLLLVGAVFTLIQRAIRRQQMDTEKLALTNDELEAIVFDRTLAIERYSQELQRSNRELQEFAFVASHDLQEPLRKIRAFGERLSTRLSPEIIGDEAMDYLKRMQLAAERMSMLINDLLEFSRVSSRPAQFSRISLQEALEDVLDTLSEGITARDALIEADPLPSIEADPTQMRQLLQNLISNALKFVAADRRPMIRITAQSHQRGAERLWYRFTVADNGIGFDQRFADRVFTPFQRLHGRGRYAGSGIGLAVCRRVVERHGGSIRAESEPGVGSRFLVELPATQRNSALPESFST